MAAVLCEPLTAGDVDGMRRLVTRGAEVAQAVIDGIRAAFEQGREQ
jgi:hypothetical protein